MRGNKRKSTRPEIAVRRILRRLGYRYLTHLTSLPGKPDFVFTKRKIVVQVNGCFWHQHRDPQCPLRSRPLTHRSYWQAKLDRNAERDVEQAEARSKLGWQTLTVWECECEDGACLSQRLTAVLGPPRSP
jgi:DNA mismatch endonuclease (patch repair protein)